MPDYIDQINRAADQLLAMVRELERLREDRAQLRVQLNLGGFND
jgi:hypothetical protein